MASMSNEYAWVFFDYKKNVISPQLILGPDGEIGGLDRSEFRRWNFREGFLTFYDDAGSMSLEFRMNPNSEPNKIVLESGPPRYATASHYLVQTEKFARKPTVSNENRLNLIPMRRKNLVVLRAGSQSLHTTWAQNIEDRDRNWDLCISWYGNEASFANRSASEYAILYKGPKWHGIYQICYQDSPIFKYEYVAFPDDDLMMTWRDINKMFIIASENRLELSQPSLTPTSYIAHPITRQQPDKILRFTDFVEIMTPIFSKKALERCYGTFYLGNSGWGLDNIWPVVMGGHRHRIGIIDAVAVRHTRPTGANYDTNAAQEDVNNICSAYGVMPSYNHFGFIH